MKNLILFTVLLWLVSCASTFDIPKGEVAYLMNEKKIDRPNASNLLFVAFEGEVLDPGFFNKTVDAVYQVPAGTRKVIAHIVYDPDSKFFANGDLAHGFYVFEYELKPKERYRINSVVEDDNATLWVSDRSGTRVTEKITKELVPFPKNLQIPIEM